MLADDVYQDINLNPFPKPDSAENIVFLVLTFGGNDQADGLPCCFGGTLTEDVFRRSVP